MLRDGFEKWSVIMYKRARNMQGNAEARTGNSGYTGSISTVSTAMALLYACMLRQKCYANWGYLVCILLVHDSFPSLYYKRPVLFFAKAPLGHWGFSG